MDIGSALVAMRKFGARVSRAGWNGKGMYLAYQPGYPDGIAINANTAKATGMPEGTVCKFLPYVMMRTAGGEFVPWLCSQTDLLAEDWSVVDAASAPSGFVWRPQDREESAAKERAQVGQQPGLDKQPPPAITLRFSRTEFTELTLAVALAGPGHIPAILAKKVIEALDADIQRMANGGLRSGI